jgi:hypothetical protein
MALSICVIGVAVSSSVKCSRLLPPGVALFFLSSYSISLYNK